MANNIVFKNSKGELREGFAEVTLHGGRYRGFFKNGKFEGHGFFEWLDGNSYCGDFKNGLQDGYGKYCWPSGGVYYGSWKKDLMHGIGQYIRKDKVKYTGYWFDDHQYGKGVKTIPEKIAHGKKKKMFPKRIIKEVWEKKRISFSFEPYIIPKIVRNSYQDIIIHTNNEEIKSEFNESIRNNVKLLKKILKDRKINFERLEIRSKKNNPILKRKLKLKSVQKAKQRKKLSFI